MTWPVNPLRGKTTDWRAVCGKSACTVRRGEGPNSIGPSYPYLPCRGNGFPAIRRRLTHGRVRYNALWSPRRCQRDRQAAYQPCRVPVALRFDEYRTARSPARASQTTARSPASAVRARGRFHGESEVRFAHGLSLAVTWRRFFPDARRTGIAWRTAACPGNAPRRGTRSAENVSCLEIGQEAGDGLVDDSRGDHEPDRSGLVQLLHEVLRRRCYNRLFLDQLFESCCYRVGFLSHR